MIRQCGRPGCRLEFRNAKARAAHERGYHQPPALPATECIEWTGPTNNHGYGVAGKRGYAHRVSWEAEHGPIPSGLVIDHLCRNPRCVNAAHMELVTQRVNVLRGISPIADNARKTHCLRGHPFDTTNTYFRPDCTGRQCQACARLRRVARLADPVAREHDRERERRRPPRDLREYARAYNADPARRARKTELERLRRARQRELRRVSQ